MKKIYLTAFFLFLFSCSSFAQNRDSQCPLVTLIEPNSAVQPGETISFSVLIQGSVKNDLNYSWALDKGMIVEGQETSTIQVSTEGLDSTTLKATLEIEGLPNGCENKFEQAGIVAPRLSCGLRDRYDRIPFEEEIFRLDNFFIELQNEPNFQGYILIKSDKNESFADIKKHIQKIIKHINYRKMPLDNFIFAIEKSDGHITTLIPILKYEELPKCEDCEIIKGSELK